MATLTLAHRELYRRAPDERFPSLDGLLDFCREQQRESRDLWKPPGQLQVAEDDFGQVQLRTGHEGLLRLNDWSFSQLCRLSMVSKDTVNRVSGETASRILRETMPQGDRPLQLLTTGDRLRSVHGVTYSRLWNADLLATVREAAGDYGPPQTAFNEATGLYCGEQDLFAFLIDPTGWIEVGDEQFAPGFFVWNSDVGKRSLGIQTFWFQKVCCNHIVWDAMDVTEFTRKHTGNIRESLNDVRRLIELQAAKRNELHGGPSSSAFARPFQSAVSDSRRAFAACCRPRSPGDVLATFSFPDVIGEITAFAFVAPVPSDPVLTVPKHRLRTGLAGARTATRETRCWTTVGDCRDSPRTPR